MVYLRSKFAPLPASFHHNRATHCILMDKSSKLKMYNFLYISTLHRGKKGLGLAWHGIASQFTTPRCCGSGAKGTRSQAQLENGTHWKGTVSGDFYLWFLWMDPAKSSDSQPEAVSNIASNFADIFDSYSIPCYVHDTKSRYALRDTEQNFDHSEKLQNFIYKLAAFFKGTVRTHRTQCTL